MLKIKDIAIILISIFLTLSISKFFLEEKPTQIVTFDRDKIYYDVISYISSNLDLEGNLTEDEFELKALDLKRKILNNFYQKINQISEEENIIFLNKSSSISKYHDQTDQIRDILSNMLNQNEML